MPQILTCPHCRNQMTVDETYAGLVVSCPSCRGSVAVPAPTAIVAPTGEANRRRGKYERARPISPVMVFIVLVGILVATAAGIFIYGKAQDVRDRDRLNEINREIIKEIDEGRSEGNQIIKLQLDEREIRRRHPEWPR